MTHICIGKLTISGLDNGLSSGWHHAIIYTNARILLIWPIQEDALENIVYEMASILSWTQYANKTRLSTYIL